VLSVSNNIIPLFFLKSLNIKRIISSIGSLIIKRNRSSISTYKKYKKNNLINEYKYKITKEQIQNICKDSMLNILNNSTISYGLYLNLKHSL